MTTPSPNILPTSYFQPAAASVSTSCSTASVSLLSDADLFLFNEGSHLQLYDRLGAHPLTVDGVDGAYFAVWAPNAAEVAVIGSFNAWDATRHPLHPRGSSGIWEGFISGAAPGDTYKYALRSRLQGQLLEKADPFAAYAATPPLTASIVWDCAYHWGDAAWMSDRVQRDALSAPISIYEVHLGSWMRVPEEGDRTLTYRELAPRLSAYVRQLGFTHVELLPVMEHPFAGSWGYQTTGYFAPTSRYGTPQDFMFLVDQLHQAGIGVILDWVPAHFPFDGVALARFDGTHLYEHADPRQGYHPDWHTAIFNYGRNEVRGFLLSSALCWLDRFHVDGLRVDAVASMLYLDYSRKPGEWVPNQYGGRENLAAITFLRRLNQEIATRFPGVQTIAEESTAWPMVTRPAAAGGLGFGMKWDMGWMHDTLRYLARDPIHRRYHHDELTFRQHYAYSEQFVLALSHDEVVHGKGALVEKMPGDDWQKFAALRLLYGYMFGLPGKKLLFMGSEFAQRREWNHDASLDWHLTVDAPHAGMQRWVSDLNQLYRSVGALHELDGSPAGFAWVDCSDREQSVLCWLRKGVFDGGAILVVCNFTPVPRPGYRLGVPYPGYWRELLNSDAREYWGSGLGNAGGAMASALSTHGHLYTLTLTLPPLATLFFYCRPFEGDGLG